jgi:enoyl-CoA hydratase/carnithine racemase
MSESYEFETIRVETPREGVLLATLDRPEKLNAIDRRMFAELSELCGRLEDDDEVRVAVLTGAGRGFCSGVDLEAIAALPDAGVPEFMRSQEQGATVIAGFRSLTKPVIAAVNGPAAGGGLALALAADVRIAAPEARFNVAFVRLGLSGADVGVSWLLPRVVGLGQASELMLTGRLIDAQEALRIGLVNRVVAAEALLDACYELAGEIARNSPFGVRLTKQALQLNVDAPSIEAAIALENRNQVLASRTEDMGEAVMAFLGKREPAFKGR